jgi:DNA-binding LacI/PurR family transcriptional regulator
VARIRPTSADVARLAGVSRTTVSFVLNGRTDITISPSTRERVLRASDALGYHTNALAAQLARGASLTIGLTLLQDPAQVASDALLPQTVQGISDAARESDYEVLVESLPPGTGGYRRLLQSRRVDGLIVSGPVEDSTELEQLQAEGSPIVLQGHIAGAHIPSVDVDNAAGASSAVAHLIEKGHRRIAMITNAPLRYTSAAERLTSYQRTLAEAGIPFDRTLVAEGAFEAQTGYAAMTQLLELTSFTAVFVASDVLALGAMGAARAKGLRIPTDLSIVGFDDIPLAEHFDPPLTTVRLPAYELGKVAGSVLLDLIRNGRTEERTILKTALKIRRSVMTLD